MYVYVCPFLCLCVGNITLLFSFLCLTELANQEETAMNIFYSVLLLNKKYITFTVLIFMILMISVATLLLVYIWVKIAQERLRYVI